MEACKAHNLEVGGSSPSSATKKTELEFLRMSDICVVNIGDIALDSRQNAGLSMGFLK